MDEYSITVGDLTPPPSEMNKPSRQKISKDIGELNSTINQLDTVNIYRLFHWITAESYSSKACMEDSTDRPHSRP